MSRLVVTDFTGAVLHTYDGTRRFLEGVVYQHTRPLAHLTFPGHPLTLPGTSWRIEETR